MFGISRQPCMHFAALVVLVWTIAADTVIAGERVLIFPEDRSVGVVSDGQPPTRESGFLSISRDFKTIGPARGTVRIPDESFIHLDLNSADAGDLSFLRQLPPDSIQSLLVERMPVDRRAMIDIARQQSLVLVIFRDCRFSSDAFEDVAPLPQLLELRFLDSTAGLLDADVPDAKANDVPRADWIAGSKRIEFLYCTPPLSTQAYKRLRNHPGLAFVNVSVGADAEELLSSLREMPSLRGLNVSVDSAGQTKDLGDLKWPAKVEVYNWSNGSIDADLLRSLSPENQLRKLRLYEVTPDKDFLGGLRDLKSLEELRLDPIDDGHVGQILAELPDVLASLPRLTSWPRFSDVDSETWDLICSTERIENLEISGVAADVTEEDTLKLGRLTHLRWLDLDNVPLSDAGLKRFSSMKDLEYLWLAHTQVTGSGFRALGGLQKLQHVDVAFEPEVTPTLKELVRLPGLESLDIRATQLQPTDLSILYDCRSLQELSLDECLIDDSTAVWLGQMPHLRQLYMNSTDSRLTDRGLRALSLSRSLQRLGVAGFFTPDGAAVLTRIPSLRSVWLSVHGYSEKKGPQAFQQKLSTIPSLEIREYLQELTIGQNGLFRDGGPNLRASLDALEMNPPPAINADEKNVFGDGRWKFEDLRGRVVLVYFWSMRHERCVGVLQDLLRLRRKYEERGLSIVGVHTMRADHLPEFLDKHPLPWPTVVDAGGGAGNAYRFHNYPSMYLIDRRGILRVAGVHRLGLEDAVQKLLDEPADGEQ